MQQGVAHLHMAAALVAQLHGTGEGVGLAQEGRGKRRMGTFVGFEGRIDLHDAAALHDSDAVAHGHRLDLIMGHQNGGDTQLALDRPQLDVHFFAQLGIQVGHRFVEQQQVGTDRQSSGNRHPLALATGQGLGVALTQPAEPHQFQCLGHARGALGPGHATHFQAEADVLRHRHVREQRVALENDAQATIFRTDVGDVAAVEDDAPLSGLHESSDRLQGRGLATPGRTEQGDELTVLNFQAQTVDGLERTVVLDEAFQCQKCHGVATQACACGSRKGSGEIERRGCISVRRYGSSAWSIRCAAG
ncbi:hypothetical protein AO269_21055 [Pseudomonas putida]|nr:hypothetical protein AO269_21055 [Pseudomonas putida]